jgi:predicted ATPase
MEIREIEICGYRSLKELRLKLGGVTILVGPNGCGKSNVYQAIQLLGSAAHGQFARRIAEEGGVPSILWAGHRQINEDFRTRLAINFDQLQYEMEFGRVPISERQSDGKYGPGLSLFKDDPDIKLETVQLSSDKPIVLFSRKGGSVRAKNLEGRTVDYPVKLLKHESVLSELREPEKFPELSSLRAMFADWRFYHDFRTDLQSPVRRNQLATMTPILSHDASDLAAVIATIRTIGDAGRFDELVSLAFPGSSVEIEEADGELCLYMNYPGLSRPLHARELSDGTLQYLCLLAALLTPRPASFMVFNEPETSIHVDLSKALAELIIAASRRSQLLITTHSSELARHVKKRGNCKIVELEKVDGETRIKGEEVLSKRAEQDDDDAAAVRAYRAGLAQKQDAMGED